jgi:hypothetical protein
MLVASALLGAAVLGLNQYVVPASLSAGRQVAGGGTPDVRELTLPELKRHGRSLGPRFQGRPAGEAEGTGGGSNPTESATPAGGLERWRALNVASFEYERRLAHAVLPFLLTWIGIMVGYWTHRLGSTQVKTAVAMSVALGLLVSIYFGGENGFEMVANRVVGPGSFAAWFIPMGPAFVLAGLGLPTLISVWTERAPSAEP